MFSDTYTPSRGIHSRNIDNSQRQTCNSSQNLRHCGDTDPGEVLAL